MQTKLTLYDEMSNPINVVVNHEGGTDTLIPENREISDFQVNYIDVDSDSMDIIEGAIAGAYSEI